MRLKLERPIVFLDLETTGVDTKKDKIVEISMVKMNIDGTIGEKRHRYVNPGIPIPAGASDVHGITDERVKDEPKFSQIAKAVLDFITDCDLCGFNSNKFDLPLLYRELAECKLILDYSKVNLIDVGNLYKILNPRTLSAAYKQYVGMELEDAHTAEADTLATATILEAMLLENEELPDDVSKLALYSNFDREILDLSGCFYMHEQEIYFSFGKHINKKAKDEKSYLQWMLGSDFSEDTKVICRRVINGN